MQIVETVPEDEMFEIDKSWRAMEIEQNTLDHARQLWERHVQQTRQDTDDRADQLKGLARLSAIIAGFSMSSFLEFNFDASTVPLGLLIAYGISTSLVAAIYTACMIHCNLILGSVLQISDAFLTREEECHFLLQCREFAIRFERGSRPPGASRNFRKMWEFRCSSSWRQCLIIFALGIPIFLVNMALSGWIKFIDYKLAAILMTVIMSLALVFLTVTFAQWISHLILTNRKAEKAVKQDSDISTLPWSWYGQEALYAKKDVYSGPFRRENAPLNHSMRVNSLTTAWRQEDMEQLHLDNALVLWNSEVRQVQSSTEENAEQMRSLSFLAGILLSFSMAALYQLVYNVDDKYNWTKLLYGLTIALTVSCNLSTMTACGFLNMAVVKSSSRTLSAENQSLFLQRCRNFAHNPSNLSPPTHATSGKDMFNDQVKIDFNLAFYLFTAGAIIFQLCLIFSAWLKFAPQQSNSKFGPVSHSGAAIAMTVVLSIGIIYLLFVTIAWSQDNTHQTTKDQSSFEKATFSLGLPFDWHLKQVAGAKTSMHADVGCTLPVYKLAMSNQVSLKTLPNSPYAIVDSSSWNPEGRNFVERNNLWAEYLAEERHLSNACLLWQRHRTRNLKDKEEREEELTAVTDLGAVVAGFEMIAFLQFQFDTLSTPKGLQIAYVLTCGFTVAFMVCSMVMCGIMLLSIIESSKEFIGAAQEADFIARCYQFRNRFQLGDRPPAPKTSLSRHWEGRCEGEWRRAFFMFSLGIPCFLANAAITSWIKFESNRPPAIVVTVLQGLALLYLLGAHARWVKHLLGMTDKERIQKVQVENQIMPFAWHAPSGR